VLTTTRGPKVFDIEQLIADAREVFEEYPAEQLEAMWQHKSYVMRAVHETKPKAGGSNRSSNYCTPTPQARPGQAKACAQVSDFGRCSTLV